MWKHEECLLTIVIIVHFLFICICSTVVYDSIYIYISVRIVMHSLYHIIADRLNKKLNCISPKKAEDVPERERKKNQTENKSQNRTTRFRVSQYDYYFHSSHHFLVVE